MSKTSYFNKKVKILTLQTYKNNEVCYSFVSNSREEWVGGGDGVKLQILGKKPSSLFNYYKRMTSKYSPLHFKKS